METKMRHNILTAILILCLGIMGGYALAQEEPPANQFIIRAVGTLPITLVKENNDVVLIPAGSDFGYEMPDGYGLKLMPL